MPAPGEGIVPTGQRTRGREQRLAPQVRGHALVPVHRHRHRGSRAADIPAPAGEHEARVGYGAQLHDRAIRVAAGAVLGVFTLTVPLPVGFTAVARV